MRPPRYPDLYESVIGPRRDEPLRILEIGISAGQGIGGWLKWLPNATITGMDTFERFFPSEVPVLRDPRVRWYRKSTCGRPPEDIGEFDYIIDDGCHWHAGQQMTFHHYFPLLRKGGVYFIEDVWPFDDMTEEQMRHPWIRRHPGAFTDASFVSLMREIREVGKDVRHDFRKGDYRTADDYVIEVRPR